MFKKIFLVFCFATICMNCSHKYQVRIGKEGERKILNLSYGDHQRNNMDVYIPRKMDQDKYAVLLIHGGAWKFGNKKHIVQIQRYLLKQGYVSLAINYTYVNRKKGITYKNQLEDITKALEKLKVFSREQNILYKGVVLLGESAGGHLALVYGYTHPEEVSKIISLSGPTDFYSDTYLNSCYYTLSNNVFERVVGATYKDISQKQEFQKASPIFLASQVPTLHFQGGRDLLVNHRQGKALDSVLTMRNIPHEFVFMPKRGHVPRLFSKKFRETILYPKLIHFLEQ